MSESTPGRMGGFKLILVGTVMAGAAMAAVTVWARGPAGGATRAALSLPPEAPFSISVTTRATPITTV